MATAVQPERILKDLAKLWVDLGKNEGQKGAVLRACAMTVIAAVEEEADAQAVSETIAQIMHQHPSRMIVMRVVADEKADLNARVFAQCWMPFGRRQQICCEEIEITASHERVEDLPKLVLGLMVPDLPVVLWCHSEGLCRDRNFQHLFPLADKIILDSARFGDPEQAKTFLRHWNGPEHRQVADLAWTRLTRLRELIAQMFENPDAVAHLRSLQTVRIRYAGPANPGPREIPLGVQYFAAWLNSRLKTRADLVAAPGEPAGNILAVDLEGPGLAAHVQMDDDSAAVSMNGLSRRISLPRHSDADLMREELSILGPDPTFLECLAAAGGA